MHNQSLSLQQDHALSVQKYYTHNWAFEFLLLEEREDGIITELEYHSPCAMTEYVHLKSWASPFFFSLDLSNRTLGFSSPLSAE